MTREESLINKRRYKLALLCIKVTPAILALIDAASTFLEFFGIDVPYLSFLGGTSVLVLLFLLAVSLLFRYCVYHRIFIYYILASNLISTVDFIWGIPVSTIWLFKVHLVMVFATIVLALYYYMKSKRYDADN